MGARLSLLAPSAPTIAVSSYVDVLHGIQYIDTINNSRFLKTIKAVDKTTGTLVIIKLFIKPTEATYMMNLKDLTDLLAKEATLVSKISNVLHWNRLIETDRAGYMIRQYLKTNLYDRLSLRPFLDPIEKSFLVYQALKTVEKLHELGVYHGDLRLENFLVTSWNWLILSDFSNYTKPVFIPEDNPTEFSFYFDSSGRRVCYLAPERFTKDKSAPSNFDEEGNYNGKKLLTPEMDLFSLGCVIGEIYTDGEPLFTLSQLFRYKRGEYIPELPISDPKIKEIVKKLINLNPSKRPSIAELLNDSDLFMPFFNSFLFEFMSVLSEPFVVPPGNVFITQSDLKIDYIRNSFDKIVEALGFSYPSSIDLNPKFSCPLSLPGIPLGYSIISTNEIVEANQANNSVLIILNVLFSLSKTIKRPASKIHFCELILALSERINDEQKLDRSLPYLCLLIDEQIESGEGSPVVICFALKAITSLIQSVSCITPLNALIFPEYILPKLISLVNNSYDSDGKISIRSCVAYCLPVLASCAKRFWAMSRSFKSQDDSFSISKEQLDEDFELLVLSLLTDNSSVVKMNLVSNILPLCRFFGVEKTNDLILPHLITYLNDSDLRLRLAFLNSLIDLGPYIGPLSFEQYLIPLLVQTLYDPELFVILKILEIFHTIFEQRIINPNSDFNSLNIFDEILSSCIHLLVYPNEWVRQSVLIIILDISNTLTNADKYCFLFPKIKSYLMYDISEFNWNSLYPCLTRPLTKQVFDLCVTWCTNATNKSLFWKSIDSKLTNNNMNHNIGKSVYASKTHTEIFFANGNQSTIPLSSEDKQWLFKLKSIGLEYKDLWKVVALRTFIFRLSKSSSSIPLETKESLKISSVRNVFFETSFKTEPVETIMKKTESVQTILKKTETRVGAQTSNSLLIPSKVGPSVQTVQANAFGELETSHESIVNGSETFEQPKFEEFRRARSATETTNIHKVFSVNNQNVITVMLKHSYQGYNPYILNYLNSLDFQPTLENFSEFGSKVTRRLMGKWVPKKINIGRINTNLNNSIDAITSIAICDTSEFFITGSESGRLRIWDLSKLEKSTMIKNANYVVKLPSPITYIKFIPRRFTFAVGTKDGEIRIYNIAVVRGKNKKIIKYANCTLIRQFKHTSEIIQFDIVQLFGKDILVSIMSNSKIIGTDIIRMETVFELENHLLFGFPTCFIINESQFWLLVGTVEGFLCLWDLRFNIMVKSWKILESGVTKSFPIKQIINHKEEICIIGGTGDSDITLWKISDFQCKQVLSAYTKHPRVKTYSLQELDPTAENQISKLLDLSNMNIENNEEIIGGSKIINNNNSMTFISSSGGYLISATRDKNMIVWNMDNPENSISFHAEFDTYFTKSQVNSNLNLINERLNLDKKANDNKTIKHQDIITGICTATIPFEMIISVDRNGYIHFDS